MTDGWPESKVPKEFLRRFEEFREELAEKMGRQDAEPLPGDKGSIMTVTNGRGEELDINIDPEFNDNKWPSVAAQQIATIHIAEWFAGFLAKNAGYGDAQDTLEPADHVQFLEIHRKYGKIRRALWDHLPIGPEDVDEVIDDMIGHLFLMRYIRSSRGYRADGLQD